MELNCIKTDNINGTLYAAKAVKCSMIFTLAPTGSSFTITFLQTTCTICHEMNKISMDLSCFCSFAAAWNF